VAIKPEKTRTQGGGGTAGRREKRKTVSDRKEKKTKRKGDPEQGRMKRNRTGKILVPQPAANPRAFTTIVFVLNGEDWAEPRGEGITEPRD